MNIQGFWYVIFCSHVGNGHNLDNVQVKTSLMDGEIILSNVSEAEIVWYNIFFHAIIPIVFYFIFSLVISCCPILE